MSATTRIKILAVIVTAIFAMLAVTATVKATTDQYSDDENSVGVCHATGSAKNPYVYIEPSKSSAHLGKHADDYPATGPEDCEVTEPTEPEYTAPVTTPVTTPEETTPVTTPEETVPEITQPGTTVEQEPTVPGGTTVTEPTVPGGTTVTPPGATVTPPEATGPGTTTVTETTPDETVPVTEPTTPDTPSTEPDTEPDTECGAFCPDGRGTIPEPPVQGTLPPVTVVISNPDTPSDTPDGSPNNQPNNDTPNNQPSDSEAAETVEVPRVVFDELVDTARQSLGNGLGRPATVLEVSGVAKANDVPSPALVAESVVAEEVASNEAGGVASGALPETGGMSLMMLVGGALLIGGGLVAVRIFRGR